MCFHGFIKWENWSDQIDFELIIIYIYYIIFQTNHKINNEPNNAPTKPHDPTFY